MPTLMNYSVKFIKELKIMIQTQLKCEHSQEIWQTTTFEVLNECITKVHIRNPKSSPWIDKNVIHLSNNKETACQSTKRSVEDEV